jgi:hypothetical protein
MRIALAFLLSGCVAMPGTSDDVPTPTAPPKPVATGPYSVHSTIDLTPELVLPEPAEMVVLTLREFSTNPGGAMIDLAADAGVPAIDDLPSYVQDKLEGWIDAEIAKVTVNGTPITQVAGSIAGLAETSLSTLDVDSRLDTTASTHTLTQVNLPAFDASFDLGVTQPATCVSSAGALAIGDHTYGLAYGEYIWTALNHKMVAEYGYDLRGALGAAVNCPSLAHTVANKCVWDYCVGHETQLTDICEAGLDEVAGRVHDKLAEMRFDALHFIAGEATLVDANLDGVAEALAAGTWTAELDAGQGLRHVPATFTGER